MNPTSQKLLNILKEIAIRKHRIKELASSGNIPEAHKVEKDLWEFALKTVSEHSPDPSAIAASALKTKTIEFDRWYSE